MPGQCPHNDKIFLNVNPWALANNSEFSICIYNVFEYGQLNLVNYKNLLYNKYNTYNTLLATPLNYHI